MKTSMITATAAITIISTFVMAVFANLPLVVAPGLGVFRRAQ
jgi:xanthine/uracil/vitamin C permease (AzgA family)